MPNLIAYLGYEEDGIDGFLCLNCKDHIRVVVGCCHPLYYCPYCGTKFEGGWIKDKKFERRKWYSKIKQPIYKQWRLESKSIEFFNKKEDDFWGIDEWEEVYRSANLNHKELLKLRDTMLQEFKEDKSRRKVSFYKKELQIRLVYRKMNYGYRENEINEIIGIVPPKKVVVRGKK